MKIGIIHANFEVVMYEIAIKDINTNPSDEVLVLWIQGVFYYMKNCKVCLQEKPFTDFFVFKNPNGNQGYHAKCKFCTNTDRMKRYLANPDLHKSVKYKAQLRNKKKDKEVARSYKRVKYLESIEQYKKNCYEYTVKRRSIDPLYKYKRDIRNKIKHHLFRVSKLGKNKYIPIFGTHWRTIRMHFESLFKEGMSWDNHGSGDGKWHVDHKIPLAKATNIEDVDKLCNYLNLQPLWSHENMRKHVS